MGSHSPGFYPRAKQVGTRFKYPGGMEAWKAECWLVIYRDGLYVSSSTLSSSSSAAAASIADSPYSHYKLKLEALSR